MDGSRRGPLHGVAHRDHRRGCHDAHHRRHSPADRRGDRSRAPTPGCAYRAPVGPARRCRRGWLRRRGRHHPARIEVAAERAASGIRSPLYPRGPGQAGSASTADTHWLPRYNRTKPAYSGASAPQRCARRPATQMGGFHRALRRRTIADLLHEAAETHHRVYRIVDGDDADWASWYADWLINLSELPQLLGRRPSAASWSTSSSASTSNTRPRTRTSRGRGTTHSGSPTGPGSVSAIWWHLLRRRLAGRGRRSSRRRARFSKRSSGICACSTVTSVPPSRGVKVTVTSSVWSDPGRTCQV